MKNDEFAPLDGDAFDEIEGMSPDQINAKIQEGMGGDRPPADPDEAAEAPSVHQEAPEDSGTPEAGEDDIFAALGLDDVLGDGSEPAAAKPKAPETKKEEPEPEAGKVGEEMAWLREQLRNQIEQSNKMAERILAMQQGPADPGEPERTIDDIDQGNREYLMPLFKPGLDAAQKLAVLERRLEALAPLEQDAHDRRYGEYLSGAVNGFKADMMPAFKSWVNKLPEDVRARYASDEAGPLGAEVLAERYLRVSGGAGSGTQPAVSPMASRAVSDMGGDSRGTGSKKGPSYEDLMSLDDDRWEKVAARLEAGM